MENTLPVKAEDARELVALARAALARRETPPSDDLDTEVAALLKAWPRGKRRRLIA